MAKKRKPDSDPLWTSDLRPAPGELRIVQAFLNTADFTQETDAASPQAVAHCLGIWGLAAPGAHLGAGDLERAIEIRETLRALLVAAQWGKASDAAADRLDRAMTDATLRARFGAGGRVRFEPASDGFDAALARICGIVVMAHLDGSWERLKICLGKTCQAAFFDFSRSRTGKWCSSRCGSRRASLAYRHRNLDSIREKDRGDAIIRRHARAHGF